MNRLRIIIGAAFVGCASLALGMGLSAATMAGGDWIPFWAYPVQPPQPPSNGPRPAPDESLHRVPNSTLALTMAQVDDVHNVPDWHPDDHPKPPDVVLHGHSPGLEACAHCHMPNGTGTLVIQAAPLAGLPAAYIEQQAADYRAGKRGPADSHFGPGRMMPFILKLANDDDIKAAAEYFASLSLRPYLRVVESAKVPATMVSGMMMAPTEGPSEAIGTRIVELPEDMERTRLKDSESGVVAYVPPGSVKRGETIVTTGALGANRGAITACTVCHGLDLKGLGPVPPIAGRSPSYIVRQLYDIREGTRAGTWSALMRPVVTKLTADDMVAIAAYTASRAP